MNPRNILLKSKSWGDFEKLIKPLNKTDKGFCFALLVRYYLLIDPQYSTEIKNDHVWFATSNPLIPEKIKKHIDYPEDIGDEGIDLFAETKEGKIWSIQAKYRSDENKSLGRKELSTFTELSFFLCKNIDLALIATPAESISYKFEKFKKYNEKISSIKHEVWSELDKEFFGRLHQYIKNQKVVITPNKKREHQKNAIADAYDHFHKNKQSRGKVIMPCGTGKTLTAYWLADKLKAKNIVVAVPSLNLIRQCLRTWAIESTADKKKVNWIAVCSDQKVKDLNKDDFQVLVKDLGIRAHTKVNEITAWLKKKKVGKNIVFTTYDSGPNLAKASKKAKFKFDVGIFDEAHRTAGNINSQSSTLLFDKNINISKRVFFTATERRYRGQSDEIISMDNEDIYGGEPCHYLSFKDALECDPPILTDYEIILVYTSKKEIFKLIKKNLLVKPKTGKWTSVMEARTLSNLVVLNKTFQDTKAKHCISYHSSIDRADAFAISQQEFAKKLKFKIIKTFHVSSRNTAVSARHRIIKSFESTSPSLITNARCLSEGVDIPKVDTILFADPRESRVDIIQAMGRALRPEKNKRKSYLLIPAMVDEEGILDDKDFQTITTVISDIGSNDEQLIDWFESVSKGKKKKGKVKVVVPKGTKVDFQKITEALQIKIYDRLKRITKEKLTEKKVIEWAKEHFKKNQAWPNEKSGKIFGLDEDWASINQALKMGYRGLAGGISLSKLLKKNNLIEDKSELTEEKIIGWAREHFKNHGKLPSERLKKVDGVNEYWNNLNQALKMGYRGLKGGSSLSQLFSKHGLDNLTEEQIIHAAKIYYKKHNKWPNEDSEGKVEGINISWGGIAAALSKGRRGLEGGTTLNKLFIKHGLKEGKKKKAKLTEKKIIEWAKAYYKKYGKWPSADSGIVDGTNETWKIIDSDLYNGRRGLKGNSSVSRLLKKYKLKK